MKAESEPKPPILLLGSFPPQAQGIPGYCGALARALAAHGPVHALGFKAMYPAWLFPGVSRAIDPTCNAPVAPNLEVRHVILWYNPIGWFWNAFAVSADLVHIQWWSLPLFPVCLTFALAAKLRRLPLVVTVHNVLPHEPSIGFRIASRTLFRLADHLLVHSETNREQLLEHFHAAWEKVSCVPMGVSAPSQHVVTKETARATLGIAPERPVLLFFGTIRAYKGLDVLLHALADVRTQHPDVLLLIAGKPWEPWSPYAEIINADALHDNVVLRLDYIPEVDVALYFAAADLVVLPYTHFDAQSAVGAQVLGHGRPLLVTDTGGLPALVQHDPKWIVPPKDPETLAETIGRFLADKEQATIDFKPIAARATSWASSAEAHWAIYEGLRPEA